jgi:ABC-type antimicrobial peptide transport system permease subunit
MERHLAAVALPARLSAGLFATFACLAVGLVIIGLYGLVSYSVAKRTREVGIRMSLGATAKSVTFMLMNSGLRLVAIGCGIGVVASLLISHALRGLLFGIDGMDWATLVAAPLILMLVAILAAFGAARRTSRIDPVHALKAE